MTLWQFEKIIIIVERIMYLEYEKSSTIKISFLNL